MGGERLGDVSCDEVVEGSAGEVMMVGGTCRKEDELEVASELEMIQMLLSGAANAVLRTGEPDVGRCCHDARCVGRKGRHGRSPTSGGV